MGNPTVPLFGDGKHLYLGLLCLGHLVLKVIVIMKMEIENLRTFEYKLNVSLLSGNHKWLVIILNATFDLVVLSFTLQSATLWLEFYSFESYGGKYYGLYLLQWRVQLAEQPLKTL